MAHAAAVNARKQGDFERAFNKLFKAAPEGDEGGGFGAGVGGEADFVKGWWEKE